VAGRGSGSAIDPFSHLGVSITISMSSGGRAAAYWRRADSARGVFGMKIRRSIIAAAICAGTALSLGSTVLAGEWAPGKPGDGYTPVKSDHVASSICAFSGRDEADENNGGNEAPDPEHGYDDPLWGSTPANGNVQSPGQLVALFGPGGADPHPGVACRGNLAGGD